MKQGEELRTYEVVCPGHELHVCDEQPRLLTAQLGRLLHKVVLYAVMHTNLLSWQQHGTLIVNIDSGMTVLVVYAYRIEPLSPVEHFPLVYVAPESLLQWLLCPVNCVMIVSYQYAGSRLHSQWGQCRPLQCKRSS